MPYGIYLFAVWLHILSAIVWVGGTLFLSLVFVPALRREAEPPRALALLQFTGLRFRSIGWICFATFVVTGMLMLEFRGIIGPRLTSAEFWSGPFGQTLAGKLLLVLAIFILSAVHDFVVGPKATEALRNAPHSPEAQRLRKQASIFGRLNLGLALLVVLLGVMLVHGRPW